MIDLGLPEDNLLWDTVVLSERLIRSLEPELLIAHEEFGAMIAASAVGVPAAFVTHWFLASQDVTMQALRHATDVIFLGARGDFAEPSHLAGRVRYVGPIVRNFTWGPSDRPACRRELGVEDDSIIVTVLPGSWTEARAPLYPLVVAAMERLGSDKRRLIWVAGSDAGDLARRSSDRPWITVLDSTAEPDRLMVASDVAITKANRTTVVELHHLGVPTISITRGLNPIDDRAIAGIPTNTTLSAERLDPDGLATHLAKLATAENDPPQTYLTDPPPKEVAASILEERIDETETQPHVS